MEVLVNERYQALPVLRLRSILRQSEQRCRLVGYLVRRFFLPGKAMRRGSIAGDRS